MTGALLGRDENIGIQKLRPFEDIESKQAAEG